MSFPIRSEKPSRCRRGKRRNRKNSRIQQRNGRPQYDSVSRKVFVTSGTPTKLPKSTRTPDNVVGIMPSKAAVTITEWQSIPSTIGHFFCVVEPNHSTVFGFGHSQDDCAAAFATGPRCEIRPRFAGESMPACSSGFIASFKLKTQTTIGSWRIRCAKDGSQLAIDTTTHRV